MNRFRVLISLRFQLIITYLLLFVVTFSLFAFYLSRRVESELKTRSLEDLLQHGTFIANLFTHSMVQHMLTPGQRRLIVQEMKRLSLRTGAFMGIVNQRAFVLENTGNLRNHWVGDRPEVREALRGHEGIVFRNEPSPVLYVAIPVFLNGVVEGAIYLSKPLDSNDEFLSSLRRNMIQAGSVALLVAFVLVFVIADLLTGSLRKITRAVRQMEAGRLKGPIVGLPPNEVGLLGAAFNQMAEALKTQMGKLSFVLGNMADGVLVIGADGGIEYVNPQARKIVQITDHKLADDAPTTLFFSE